MKFPCVSYFFGTIFVILQTRNHLRFVKMYAELGIQVKRLKGAADQLRDLSLGFHLTLGFPNQMLHRRLNVL